MRLKIPLSWIQLEDLSLQIKPRSFAEMKMKIEKKKEEEEGKDGEENKLQEKCHRCQESTEGFNAP